MASSKISGDSVRAYLRDIGRIPLLEHDEEILLGRQVQRLMQLEEMKKELSLCNDGLAEAMDIPVKQIKKELRDGTKAKDKMVTANLRLVVSVAKKYTKRNMELLDIIQEGTIGSSVALRSLTLVVATSLVLMLIGGFAKVSRGQSLKNRGRSAYQSTLQRTSTNLRKPSVSTIDQRSYTYRV